MLISDLPTEFQNRRLYLSRFDGDIYSRLRIVSGLQTRRALQKWEEFDFLGATINFGVGAPETVLTSRSVEHKADYGQALETETVVYVSGEPKEGEYGRHGLWRKSWEIGGDGPTISSIYFWAGANLPEFCADEVYDRETPICIAIPASLERRYEESPLKVIRGLADCIKFPGSLSDVYFFLIASVGARIKVFGEEIAVDGNGATRMR